MKQRLVLFSLGICGLFLLVTCKPATPPFQCTDAIGCVKIAPDQPIKIGLLPALSGDLKPFGMELINVWDLIRAERGGKLLGHPVTAQPEDSLCSGEGGTTSALKLAADPQLVAIVGPSCSASAITAAKVMSKAGLVMVSSSASAPSLTAVEGKQSPDWQPGFFRVVHNDVMMGRAAAVFAFQQLGVKKAATLDEGDIYTQGLAQAFNQVFTQLGGTIVLTTAINKEDTDMRPVLTAIAEAGAEFLFFPVYPTEGAALVRQAQSLPGFASIRLLSAEIVTNQAFIEAVGATGVGMYFVTPAPPGGADYETFRAKYIAKYGESSGWYYAHNYDALNVALIAIEKVAIQEKDGTLHIGRQALRDALYATAGYQGITGRLTCDKFGDCAAARFNIMRLDDPAMGIQGLMANVIYTYAPDQQAPSK